jgi:hypothetical protein
MPLVVPQRDLHEVRKILQARYAGCFLARTQCPTELQKNTIVIIKDNHQK